MFSSVADQAQKEIDIWMRKSLVNPVQEESESARRNVYTAVILLAFLVVGIRPTVAAINIPGDESVGTWYPDDKKYVLNQNVSDTIILSNPLWDGSSTPTGGAPTPNDEDDRIIFDGGGHTISAPTNPSPNYYGISFDQIATSQNGYITIQNLNITGCDVGINIQTATRINMMYTNISDCQYGISIGNAGTCIITDNTISACSEYGIWLSGAIDNTIYNNNFLNNGIQAGVYAGSTGNVFDGGDPYDGGQGGNYWSDYTGVDEDVPPDGIGDTPYTFTGGQDNYPLIFPLPLTLQTTAILYIMDLIGDAATLNLQQGINNSLDAKLDAALKALDDVNQNNNVAAINALYAFINAVEAQSGNKISEEDADGLIAAAEVIIAML
ncbi:MAG: NosD domain-containing protein [Anaerolineae bacterium]